MKAMPIIRLIMNYWNIGRYYNNFIKGEARKGFAFFYVVNESYRPKISWFIIKAQHQEMR